MYSVRILVFRANNCHIKGLGLKEFCDIGLFLVTLLHYSCTAQKMEREAFKVFYSKVTKNLQVPALDFSKLGILSIFQLESTTNKSGKSKLIASH